MTFVDPLKDFRDFFRDNVCPVDGCPFTSDVTGKMMSPERYPVIQSSCHGCKAIHLFEEIRYLLKHDTTPVQILDRVTVTGADDSVSVDDLVRIQQVFPYVEWGILLSKSQEGAPRFPSMKWVEKLIEAKDQLSLSGHLCGRWVRDICDGKNTLYEDRPQLKGLFDRYQLNFHSYVHKIKDRKAFAEAVQSLNAKQIILQFDEVNDHLLHLLYMQAVHAVPLFDASGGAGIIPDTWPEALDLLYCGYAGGLSVDNLGQQLKKISRVCGRDLPIWIDAETHLRSPDNKQFDLKVVGDFLSEARPWIRG